MSSLDTYNHMTQDQQEAFFYYTMNDFKSVLKWNNSLYKINKELESLGYKVVENVS